MSSAEGKIRGVFYSTRVIVWDIESARKLWSMGFYGKPLGIYKPKSPDFNSPLLLDLLEATYLLEKGTLEIEDADGTPLDLEKMKEASRKTYTRFDEKYAVYKDLRDKGLVVLSGLKFGVDFAVYTRGPGLEHAPYLVDVVDVNYQMSGDELIRIGRLATTVRKRFVLAIPNLAEGKVKYIIFSWWKG